MNFLHKLVCAAIALLVLCKSARCENECTFALNITTGEHYLLRNPTFPNNYRPGIDCTWKVTTSQGHRVKLTCDNINMPLADDNSCMDYLAVTTTGDLRDASAYCVPFNATGSSLRIQLISSRWSLGGIYSCHITAEKIPVAGPNQTENCECGWSQSDWKAQMEEIGDRVLIIIPAFRFYVLNIVCARPQEYMLLKLSDERIKSAPTNPELFNDLCIITKLFANKTRIFGGAYAEPNEFPSTVRIVRFLNERKTRRCGGTIIGRRVVLTAAHCMVPEHLYTGLIVGKNVITESDERDITKHLKISRVIIHPNVSESEGNHDIALLETATDIEYTSSVGPACLPFNIKNEDLIGEYITIAGWGQLKDGSYPESLHKLSLPIVPDLKCTSTYSKSRFIPQYYLCTFETGKSSCYGDSGSGIYYFNHQKSCHMIVGIVEGVVVCGGSPTMHTEVHYHLPWILDQFPDVEFCKK